MHSTDFPDYDKEWVLEYSSVVNEIVAKLPPSMRMRIPSKLRDISDEGRWELAFPLEESGLGIILAHSEQRIPEDELAVRGSTLYWSISVSGYFRISQSRTGSGDISNVIITSHAHLPLIPLNLFAEN